MVDEVPDDELAGDELVREALVVAVGAAWVATWSLVRVTVTTTPTIAINPAMAPIAVRTPFVMAPVYPLGVAISVTPPHSAAASCRVQPRRLLTDHRRYLEPDASFLVDYDLEPPQHDDPLTYSPDQHWAAPRLDHAVECLRAVAADIDGAKARAAPQRERVLHDYAGPQVVAMLRDAVPELGLSSRTS